MPESHLGSKSEVTRLESILCGGLAGLVSRFVVSPLDVLKIRLQLEVHDRKLRVKQPGAAMIRTAVQIFKTEGIRGFWKGNISAEGMYVMYGAVEFSTYKAINQLMNQFSPNGSNKVNHFVSGSAAGTFATCMTYPLDLLRTRFAAQQNASKQVYFGVVQAIKHIYSHEGGPKGFYRGLGATLCSVVPNMGLFFMIYEETRSLMNQIPRVDVLPAPEASAGLLAGSLSKTIVFPFDTIRKRLQVQGPSRESFGHNVPEYPSGPMKCAKLVLANEGVRGLYKGYAVSLIKSAPSSAVTVWTFENSLDLIRYFKNAEKPF